MRAVLIALSALGLGACNMVVSEAPLFGPADEDKATAFRQGLWVETKSDCAVDAATPAADLPECADAVVLGDGKMTDPEKPDEVMPYVLAKGDPNVLQIRIEQTGLGRALKLYAYAAVDPTRRDDAGRVVEARRWPVLCGPPPGEPDANRTETKATDYTTRQPLPGMEVDADLGACWAADAAAVRGAARASEAWDEDKAVIRWLRDRP